MSKRLFLATLVSLVVTAASSAREPTLTVVLSDHYQLFPPTALGTLAEDLHRFFASYDISVRLHVFQSGENLRDIPSPRVNAIVTEVDGSRYRATREAMAATIGERGGERNIFVFFPGVTSALGHQRDEPVPRRLREVARAMARVLAHELVHVLAPERPHTKTGLMSETLRRRDLVEKSIELDAPSVRVVKARMRKWASSDRAVAEASEEPPRPAVPARSPRDPMFKIS